jgi:hypothetical protein
MSLVFDSIWHWREEYQARGRGTLDGKSDPSFPVSSSKLRQPPLVALKQPTNPDSANESSASSTHLDSTLMPPSHNMPSTLNIATSNGALTPSAASGLAGTGQGSSVLGMNYENSYDVWDPQHWMLDGLLDFNYAFVPPLEGS